MACDRALPLLCFSELAKQLGQEVPEAMLKLPAEYNGRVRPATPPAASANRPVFSSRVATLLQVHGMLTSRCGM